MQSVQLKNGNMRENGIEVNLAKTKNVKLAEEIVGLESGAQIFQMDAPSVEQLAKDKAREEFNNQVDEYVEKLEQHENLLNQYKEEVLKDINNVEIVPAYEGILIKPYDENPFQRIKKEGNLIVDLGGQKPTYKSHEDGKFHEEESFIRVGLVLESGPTAKFVQEGDIVMWRRPSETPVPFYKQNLVLVNEHSIMTIVNEGLTKRLKNKENGE
jgi:hypothetical protein